MKVYALGVMQIEYDHRSKDDAEPSFIRKSERLWAIFADFEQAEKAMLENYGDLFEFSYNVGLIEEVYVWGTPDPDASRISERRWWYHAQYTPNPEAPFGMDGPVVTKMECPIQYERVVNFWVG